MAQKNTAKPRSHRLRNFVILMALLLTVWFVLRNESRDADSAAQKVAISAIIQQVESGNVQEIIIQGEEVKAKDSQGKTYLAVSGDTKILREVAHQKKIRLEERTVDKNGTTFLMTLIPTLLFFVLFWLVFLRGSRAVGQMMNRQQEMGQAKASKETPTTRFTDVAGVAEAKANAQAIINFLRNPDKVRKLGGRLPKGVLLKGPPGTGKTLLAKAIAGEAGVPFLSMAASEFVEMFVGVGAARVRSLFAQARACAPCILFIDEADALGTRGGVSSTGGSDEKLQTLNQLLAEMDGFSDSDNIIVLAATNRPECMDAALLRPNRFDRHLTLDIPRLKDREQILGVHVRKMPLADNVNLAALAQATPGITGAGLESIANEAALAASKANKSAVEQADFLEAIRVAMLGGEAKKGFVLSAAERLTIAVHEAGHALAAHFTAGCDPLHAISIIPRGQGLGVTVGLPVEDRTLHTKTWMLGRLVSALGGRMAEELVRGEITNGASEDLTVATGLAKQMVCQWAMGEGLGVRTYGVRRQGAFLDYATEQRDYSEATAQAVDAEIERLLTDANDRARTIITERRDILDRLVEALLEHETLEADQINAILGPRPTAAETATD